MYVQQFFVDGLGCASYLIGSEARGVAVVVDPDRFVQPYIEAAESLGLAITHIIETHLHADHVSGNTELAERTGAGIYIHAAAGAGFPHHALQDGDVITLGEARLRVEHTPGHTPESVTLLVSDTSRSETPWMALTGDLLMVGDVGRPDLVSAEAARSQAGELYESLFQKIFAHPDGLMIYPGHGAGSLCGRSLANVRHTTLGYERSFNPALSLKDKVRFVDYMTTDLPEQPGNHVRIKAINRAGPPLLGEIAPQPLTVAAAIPHFQNGAALLDVRSKEAFVAAHVPGSVHLEAGEPSCGALSNRVGFVLPPDQPLVLLLDDPDQYIPVVYCLARVGFDHLAGYLKDGIAGWQKAGYVVASGDIEDLTPQELHAMLQGENPPVVLDVREPWEYHRGHIPGALLIPLGQLAVRVSELDPAHPVAAVCHSGNRSQSAAALLGQKGFNKVYNVLDGMHGWQKAGLEIRTGN